VLSLEKLFLLEQSLQLLVRGKNHSPAKKQEIKEKRLSKQKTKLMAAIQDMLSKI
jgi:hypothetical protein